MGGKVILGMPGKWAVNYREPADHYTTKIGGLPDWPIPSADIKPDLLKCGQCGSHLCLVSQVYAPISCDIEERIIYVFGCAMQKCRNTTLSWRALRVQNSKRKEETSSADTEITSEVASIDTLSSSKPLEEDSLSHGNGENADDLNNGDMDLEELARALSEAASLASHSKSKKKKANRKLKSVVNGSSASPVAEVIDTSIPVLPCFYIYSQEEKSRDVDAVCSNCSSLSIKEKENGLDDCRDEESWEGETYEYDKALYVDRTYLKFKKRMDAYPEQCFRYLYGGGPLLATKELKVPGNCKSCGSPRHYEMQLMPPLLFFLREGSDSSSTYSPEEWNWMTLIVCTCSKSCSHPVNQDKSRSNNWTVAEETVIVQFE